MQNNTLTQQEVGEGSVKERERENAPNINFSHYCLTNTFTSNHRKDLRRQCIF